jgi:putative transcription antitermination factor YqgF
MSREYTNALGIDLGQSKVGLARVNSIARIPSPLAVVPNDALLLEYLGHVIKEENIDHLVFGVPRNMQGEMTSHSSELASQATKLAEELNLPYTLQDETLSTVRAQEWQRLHGQTTDDDAISACIILEDFSSDMQNSSDKIDNDV